MTTRNPQTTGNTVGFRLLTYVTGQTSARGVNIQDLLPAGFTCVGTCSRANQSVARGTRSYAIQATLTTNPGVHTQLINTGTINSAYTGVHIIACNNPIVTASTTLAGCDNTNTAGRDLATFQIDGYPDLTSDISYAGTNNDTTNPDDPYDGNDAIYFDVTFANNGNETGTNVTASVSFPSFAATLPNGSNVQGMLTGRVAPNLFGVAPTINYATRTITWA